MKNPEWLEKWCKEVEGIYKGTDGIWTSITSSEVSFPTDTQSELAKVEEISYWFAHRNNIIADVVALFPPNGPIFDIGGGNGFVARGLIARGYDAMVIEPGHLGTISCTSRDVPVVRAAFQDIVPPKERTSAIGLFDVLEHIENDDAALFRLNQTLIPSGMLYVAVPAFQSLWSQEDIDGGHFRRYSVSGLREKLNRAGFEVEFETYFFASLVLPMFFLRTLPTKLGVRSHVNMKQTAAEHSLPKGPIGHWLSRSFEKEQQLISGGRSVSYGTSCIVAARKIT
ncbi:class I SAM-dependent methyltransferase [Rhizobium sp. 18065]|uniref:class I SAM-dependent methyltransferase n=1 Tax=Rhizobium sp. 18065 TaxID=2681411 RepID=UPI00135B7116|nr:class I SAM-dependent methyltransferase [Rhizobium sp. 18065]